MTLAIAALAVVASCVSPYLVKPVEEASERRREETRVRGENRVRFERHALDLNSHAFAPMVAVVLESPLGNPPIYGNLNRPGGTGLHVRLANAQQAAVEGLPNWQLAHEHLSANPTLKRSWEETVEKARRYYELREATFNATVARLTQLVREEYGPQMQIVGGMGSNPPWFDVAGTAWFIIGRRGPLNRRDFFNPGINPQTSEDHPRMVSTGSGYFVSTAQRRRGRPGSLSKNLRHRLGGSPTRTRSSGHRYGRVHRLLCCIGAGRARQSVLE